MKITALAPWFGSKRTLAPKIIQAIGSHRAYWEPFCGSLAVLMAKPAVTMEVANDLHGDLINLARVVQNQSYAADLYGRLGRVLMHEDIHQDAAAEIQNEIHRGGVYPNVDRAAAFMVASWFGRNGLAGTPAVNSGFCVRYSAKGGHAATRWRSAVESIPDWHERLKNVVILNRDGFELLERIDDADGTAVYCDPPYLVKGGKYVHDFALADHKRLADSLSRFTSARVVVSYYDHPSLESLYPVNRWSKIDCTMRKQMASQNKMSANDAKAPEVLLVNTAGLVAIGVAA